MGSHDRKTQLPLGTVSNVFEDSRGVELLLRLTHLFGWNVSQVNSDSERLVITHTESRQYVEVHLPSGNGSSEQVVQLNGRAIAFREGALYLAEQTLVGFNAATTALPRGKGVKRLREGGAGLSAPEGDLDHGTPNGKRPRPRTFAVKKENPGEEVEVDSIKPDHSHLHNSVGNSVESPTVHAESDAGSLRTDGKLEAIVASESLVKAPQDIKPIDRVSDVLEGETQGGVAKYGGAARGRVRASSIAFKGHTLTPVQPLPITASDGFEASTSASFLAHSRTLSRRYALWLHDRAAPSLVDRLAAEGVASREIRQSMVNGLSATVVTHDLRGDVLYAGVQALQLAENENHHYGASHSVQAEGVASSLLPFPRQLPRTFLPVSGAILARIQEARDAVPEATVNRVLPGGLQRTDRICIRETYDLRGSFMSKGDVPDRGGRLPQVTDNDHSDLVLYAHRRFLPRGLGEKGGAEEVAATRPNHRPPPLIKVDAERDIDKVLRHSDHIKRIPMPEVEWRHGFN